MYLQIHFLPRSKHPPSVRKTDQLMLYWEMIAVCSLIRKNTPSGHNVELLKFKPGGTCSNHWTLKGYLMFFRPCIIV